MKTGFLTLLLCALSVPLAAEMRITTTELSPAVLVTTTERRLSLFASTEAWGLGAPAQILLPLREKTGSFSRLQSTKRWTDAKGLLREGWTLVWFRGAKGWEAWDAPWLIVWQRNPTALTLNENGLRAEAREPLGDIALMPLYGLGKPDTRSWNPPPADVIQRCRFWSRVLRFYPLYCRERFRIDPAQDALIIENAFTWRQIKDDWRTPPLKFAPVSPTLALAKQGGLMPMRFSAPLHDPQVVTAFGPCMGVLNADRYTVSFPILRYIVETEQEPSPDLSNPVVAEARRRLLNAMTESFSSPDGLFHQDFGDPPTFAKPPQEQDNENGNTCWAVVSAQYYCRALPYLPAELREKAKPRLRRYFADWILQPRRYQPFRGKLLLFGPGIGAWGGYDDAGKFSSNVILTLWTYARYTGDYALIKERWDLVRKLFITPRETTWRGFGRDTIAEMGDKAAPALAMARLAWFVGDRETFAFAAYIFARELVHHAVMQNGAAYFVRHQPLFSLERMPPNVYLTNLWGDIAGWQIDGPTYPAVTGERQYENRWVRFGDPDVARFHRDHLQALNRAELDGLLASGAFTTRRQNTLDDPHILPSIVRLRSLVLHEPPERLAAILPVGANVHSNSGIAAHCMAYLRVSRAPRFAPLIPRAQTATDWQRGLERERPEGDAVLTATVQWSAGRESRVGAPAVTWFGWKPPKSSPNLPGGDRWSFGQILAEKPPVSGREQVLNWNTRVVHLAP